MICGVESTTGTIFDIVIGPLLRNGEKCILQTYFKLVAYFDKATSWQWGRTELIPRNLRSGLRFLMQSKNHHSLGHSIMGVQ